MKKGWWVISIVIIILIAGIIIFSKSVDNVNVDVNKSDAGEGYCTSDSDCVPATTCHPDSCALKSEVTKEKGVLCTQVCEPGTLDCGQGYCACVNKKCEAIIK